MAFLNQVRSQVTLKKGKGVCFREPEKEHMPKVASIPGKDEDLVMGDFLAS
jgi:hypothetical protein